MTSQEVFKPGQYVDVILATGYCLDIAEGIKEMMTMLEIQIKR